MDLFVVFTAGDAGLTVGVAVMMGLAVVARRPQVVEDRVSAGLRRDVAKMMHPSSEPMPEWMRPKGYG